MYISIKFHNGISPFWFLTDFNINEIERQEKNRRFISPPKEVENSRPNIVKFYYNDRLQKNLNNLSPLNYKEQNSITVKNNVNN